MQLRARTLTVEDQQAKRINTELTGYVAERDGYKLYLWHKKQ